MRIDLNGKPLTTQATTLTQLLAELDLDAASVATALEGVFVPRSRRDQTRLTAGAKVEVLTPMEGG